MSRVVDGDVDVLDNVVTYVDIVSTAVVKVVVSLVVVMSLMSSLNLIAINELMIVVENGIITFKSLTKESSPRQITALPTT